MDETSSPYMEIRHFHAFLAHGLSCLARESENHAPGRELLLIG